MANRIMCLLAVLLVIAAIDSHFTNYNWDDDYAPSYHQLLRQVPWHLKVASTLAKWGSREIHKRISNYKNIKDIASGVPSPKYYPPINHDSPYPPLHSKSNWPWPIRNWSWSRGQLQSPVNLDITYLQVVDLPKLRFQMDWTLSKENIVLTNNGHTWSISLAEGVDNPPYITGGPLQPGKYIFNEAHGHWSSEDFAGSEHLIMGLSYSMEMHIVFYKEEYGSFQNAINFTDGVSVVTFFGEVGAEENPKMDALIENIPQIVQPGSSVEASFGSEFKFLQDVMIDTQTYYSYPGSLTTEPFSECVTWLLFMKPFFLSERQLNSFHALISNTGKHIGINDRELQPFNGRPLISPLDYKPVEIIIDRNSK